MVEARGEAREQPLRGAAAVAGPRAAASRVIFASHLKERDEVQTRV